MSSRALDDPVLERRRLAALDQIRQFGDPVLRAPALEITEFDEALADEAERMAAIMADARGVGLAAPQVGSLRRLVVVRFGEEGEQVLALCNPRITWRSDEEETDSEGCLSIGEISVDVSRARGHPRRGPGHRGPAPGARARGLRGQGPPARA